MNSQKRSRTRVNYSTHVFLKSKGEGIVQGVLHDISINSMYLKCQPIFQEGENVDIEIVLEGGESELVIRTPGQVVRIDTDGVAVSFPTPLEWWPVFSLFPFHKLDIE